MKLSKALSDQRGLGNHFPVRGIDGYGGEQDGSQVLLSDVYVVRSKAEADELYPSGLPEGFHVHWSSYDAGYHGWSFVLGVCCAPDGFAWPKRGW